MAPSARTKKSTENPTTEQHHQSLTGAWISSGGDVDLLRRLLTTSSHLESLPTSATSKQFDAAFIEELLRRPIMRNPNPEVRLVLSCILAEVLRLSFGPQTPATAAGTAAAGFPWKKDHHNEVMTLLVDSLSAEPSKNSMPHRRHVLETLSVSHALIPLIRNSKLSESTTSQLFNALLMSSSAGSTNIDDAYASASASAMADIVTAKEAITDIQVELVVTALHDITAGGDSASGASAASGNAPRKIATALLRRQEILDSAQSALVPILVGKFESFADEIHEIDTTGGGDAALDTTSRRVKVREMNHTIEKFVDVAAASTVAVSQVIQNLSKLVANHDCVDARVALVKGLGRAFATIPALAVEYSQSLFAVAGRVHDIKPQVRLHTVPFIGQVLAAHTDGNNSDALWSQLPMALITALVDGEEAVRKAALIGTLDLAKACPDRIPMSLLREAGNRCIDRRPPVRALALERFAQFYQALRSQQLDKCSWIPNRIFDTAHLDQDTFVVERVFESMLPPASRLQQLDASSGAGRGGGNKKKGATTQLSLDDFGFDKPLGMFSSSSSPKNNSSNADSKSTTTFVEGFVTLMEDLQDTHRQMIFALMDKKKKLRLCVEGLYEARDEAKKSGKAGLETEHGQFLTDKIRRLIQVLQSKTRAGEAMWDTLFKLRDERAVRGLVGLASLDVLDFDSSREEARSRLGASLKKDVQTYVEQNLLIRMCMPFSQAHVSELVQQVGAIRESINGFSVHTSPERVASVEKRYLALMDSLHAMALHSPQLLSHVATDVTNWITTDGAQEQPEARGAALARLLDVFTAVANFSSANSGRSVAAGVFAEKRTDIARALGKLCLFSRAGTVAVSAASCMTTLYPTEKNLYKQLVPAIKSRLAETVQASFASWSPYIAGWLGAFAKLANVAPEHVAADGDDISSSCASVLVAACRATATTGPRLGGGGNNASAAGEPIETMNCSSKKTPPLATLANSCPSASIVDAAARAVVTYARSLQQASRSGPAIRDAFQLLVNGLRACSEAGVATVGAALKRLAIYRQLLAIAENPIDSGDLRLEIQTAICISAETNNYVRSQVQQIISTVVQSGAVDVRYLALLIMTAISEEHRSTYNTARAHLIHAADKMHNRLQMAGESIPFSDPRAMKLYPEYTIPFLVLYLAHHSFYDSEKSNNFNGFQRVWHLLFDVVLKNGTQSVPFIQEMWRKLKALDDGLDPASPKSREMIDLGAKVLQAVLAQKQVGSATYPGTILLPRCFTKPGSSGSKQQQQQHSAEQIYLADSVVCGPNPPFRAAPTVTPSKFGGRSQSRGVSQAREEDDVLDGDAEAMAAPFDVFASGGGVSAGSRRERTDLLQAVDEETPQPAKPRNSAATTTTTTANKKQVAATAGSPAAATTRNTSPKHLKEDEAAAAGDDRHQRFSHGKKFPPAPKGMDKAVADVIRTACENCESKNDILSLKMKFLQTEIEKKTGSKPNKSVMELVKDYAGTIVESFFSEE